jgi:hypothetical protein
MPTAANTTQPGAERSPGPERIRPGVRCHSFQGLPLAERLSLSRGTERATTVRTGSPYMTGAFKPRTPWRPVDRAEAELLIGEPAGSQSYACIALVRLRERALRLLVEAGLHQARSRADLNRLMAHPSYPAAHAAVEEEVRRYAEVGTDLAWHPLYCSPPDMETVTHALGALRYVGLHVDHWDELPADRAVAARNRMVINLGLHPRYLLFVNLTLDQIRERCGFPEIDRSGEGPPESQQNVLHNLVVHFCRAFPAYPVTRLRVDPGEAYIAPTENIVHDGSSAGASTIDVTLTARGHLAPRALR